MYGPKGERGGWGELEGWDSQTYTPMYEMGN